MNQPEETGTGTRLTYEAPKLHKHGSIHEITLTSSMSSNAPDGGNFPSIYTDTAVS